MVFHLCGQTTALGMVKYRVYIDEAGDEGFGKIHSVQQSGQSRWIVLGACIVSKENDLELPAWRDQIISRFPHRSRRDLHFRDFNHDQKIVVCQEIAQRPVGVIFALIHKVTIPGSRYESAFKTKGSLYTYLMRRLLERVTAACARKSGPESGCIELVLSRRGGTDYETMQRQLRALHDHRSSVMSHRSQNWRMIDFSRTLVDDHKKWAGLQLSDCMTSAFFMGIEPNFYGNYETSYARILKSRLVRKNGTSINSGLIVLPPRPRCQLDTEQAAFFKFFESSGQAPGS